MVLRYFLLGFFNELVFLRVLEQVLVPVLNPLSQRIFQVAALLMQSFSGVDTGVYLIDQPIQVVVVDPAFALLQRTLNLSQHLLERVLVIVYLFEVFTVVCVLTKQLLSYLKDLLVVRVLMNSSLDIHLKVVHPVVKSQDPLCQLVDESFSFL